MFAQLSALKLEMENAASPFSPVQEVSPLQACPLVYLGKLAPLLLPDLVVEQVLGILI